MSINESNKKKYETKTNEEDDDMDKYNDDIKTIEVVLNLQINGICRVVLNLPSESMLILHV